MASLNALPGLKVGFFDALILIASPVWGFLPLRAGRFLTKNDPNPTKVT